MEKGKTGKPEGGSRIGGDLRGMVMCNYKKLDRSGAVWEGGRGRMARIITAQIAPDRPHRGFSAIDSDTDPYLCLSLAVRHSSGSHDYENESYEAFNSRYQTFFTQVEDVFELQRGLNNCFAYDLVPATEVVEAALRASRKVNDYATAVRILEGVKEKVENKLQYQAYLDELKPVIQELGECPGGSASLRCSSSWLKSPLWIRSPY